VQVQVLSLALLVLDVGRPLLLQLLDHWRDVLAQNPLNLVQLRVLLLNDGQSVGFFHVVGLGAGSLLDHGQDLYGLHVQHLGDFALHNQEVRVVDIQLDTAEEIADTLGCGVLAIDQIFVFTTN